MSKRTFQALCLSLTLLVAALSAQAADPMKRPGDFRDIPWGANPDKVPGLSPVDRDGDIVHYDRKAEKKELGGIALRHVTYSFFKNRFYHAEIDYDGEGSFAALQSALAAKYGPPDSVRQKTDASGNPYEVATWNWSGYAFIGNRHDIKSNNGRIFYFYAPITDEVENERPSVDKKTADKPAPAGQPAGKPAARTYTVKRGDSMERIAKRLAVGEKALSMANGGLTDKDLKADTVINVPQRDTTIEAPQSAPEPKPSAPAAEPKPSAPGAESEPAKAPRPKPAATAGTTYTIKQGDVLSKVAASHGVSVKDILAANPGLKADALSLGTKLRIPAKR